MLPARANICVGNNVSSFARAFKDIHMKFSSRRMFFLKFLLQSNNELLVSEMQKLQVNDIVSEIKRVEN